VAGLDPAAFDLLVPAIPLPVRADPGDTAEIMAALAFEFAKLAFSLYLEYFTNYDVVFGSLGAVVAFMFWVYVSAGIMLYGAELIAAMPAELDRVQQASLGGVRVPLSQKVARILKGLVVTQKT
jgi:hypothetical protein